MWAFHLPLKKCEGPTTRIIFLGIELDSIEMSARLPAEKLTELIDLREWRSKKSYKPKEVQSLVGKLNHACSVIPCGRTFLRRLIDLLKGAQRFRPFLRLNKQCQLDIAWWQEFLPSWDGVYFFDLPNWAPSPDISLSSDAAGSLGFGGGGETMANYSMVHGSHRSNPYASRIRNCSRLF